MGHPIYLAHLVTPFEICAPAAWSMIAISALAVIALSVRLIRKAPRTFTWIIVGLWVVCFAAYSIGMRTYITSKPPGYWCQNALIENLRILGVTNAIQRQVQSPPSPVK